MYHLDKKQIQEITDYIFLEDRLEKGRCDIYTRLCKTGAYGRSGKSI